MPFSNVRTTNRVGLGLEADYTKNHNLWSGAVALEGEWAAVPNWFAVGFALRSGFESTALTNGQTDVTGALRSVDLGVKVTVATDGAGSTLALVGKLALVNLHLESAHGDVVSVGGGVMGIVSPGNFHLLTALSYGHDFSVSSDYSDMNQVDWVFQPSYAFSRVHNLLASVSGALAFADSGFSHTLNAGLGYQYVGLFQAHVFKFSILFEMPLTRLDGFQLATLAKGAWEF